MAALYHVVSCIVLSIVVFNNNMSTAGNADINELLYNTVYNGLYHEAVHITKRIVLANHTDQLKQTVNTMLDNNVKTVFNFGYKLWELEDGGQTIVVTMFPELFKCLFNEDEVRIYSKEANANVSTPGGNTGWIFSPVWKHNRVYFKIMSALHTCYLGFSNEAYSCDVLQEEPTELKYLWLVQAAGHYDDSFNIFIINNIHNVPLMTNSNGEILAKPSSFIQSRLQLLKVDPTLKLPEPEYNHELYNAVRGVRGEEYAPATNMVDALNNHNHGDYVNITIQKTYFNKA